MKGFTLPRKILRIKSVQMWIIGLDSYLHSPLQDSLKSLPRSSHIVDNRTLSQLFGIVM